MKSFQEKLAEIPIHIKQSFSIGFVYFVVAGKYQHFPARQWSEKQILDYFKNRYDELGEIIPHDSDLLKELKLPNHPEVFIVIPYRKDKNN